MFMEHCCVSGIAPGAGDAMGTREVTLLLSGGLHSDRANEGVQEYINKNITSMPRRSIEQVEM